MNYELLEEFDIYVKSPMDAKEEIEAKIMEIDERLDNVEDEERRTKLEKDKSKLNYLLMEAKKLLEVSEKKEEKEANIITFEEEKKEELNIPVTIIEEIKVTPKKEVDKEKDNAKHEEELRKKAAELQKKQKAEQVKQEKREIKENKEKEIKEANETAEKIFQSGLKAMNNRDYMMAYNEFYRVVNPDNKGNEIIGKLSKSHESEAMFFLGRIYYNGLSKPIDINRGIFWYKKAADLDNCEACLELGMYYAGKRPNDFKEQMDNLDNALDYFKKAGDLGKKEAMKKFIELCLNSSSVKILNKQKYTAKLYCKKLEELESDAYVKEGWKKKRKDIGKLSIRDKEQIAIFVQKLMYVLGIVAELYGAILLWGGLLSSSDNKIIKFAYLPKVSTLPYPIIASKIVNMISKGSMMFSYTNEGMIMSSIWFFIVGALICGFFGKRIHKVTKLCFEVVILSLIGIGGFMGAIIASYNIKMFSFNIFPIIRQLLGIMMICFVYNIISKELAKKISGE